MIFKNGTKPMISYNNNYIIADTASTYTVNHRTIQYQ